VKKSARAQPKLNVTFFLSAILFLIVVSTLLELKDQRDFVSGDNSLIIPTDTQKNTVYAIAQKRGVSTTVYAITPKHGASTTVEVITPKRGESTGLAHSLDLLADYASS